ncbi:MAG: TonB-dependent receptor, partial [Myxococcales bacterium]
MASSTPGQRARRRAVAGACALGSLLGARGARADEVVVTGTRTPESARSSAVRVDVIDREEIARRGALTVADALASQPGVRVAPGDYGYLGGVSGLQIQGFDRDRVLILEDNERIIGDVGGAIDLSSLPTTDITQIEIVTGPQSALYGASAIGGVVNIRTGPPLRLGLSGRAQVEARSRGGVVARATGAYREDERWVQLEAGTTRQGEVAGAGPTPLLPE